MDFAALLLDSGLATVVGEGAGNMPSSHGNNPYFQIPNAALAFTVSYQCFIPPDASKPDTP